MRKPPFYAGNMTHTVGDCLNVWFDVSVVELVT
jgi:hypothetical protein